ncbi:MAG: hypothetical protein KAH38_12560, partial [Candidatus Hydrogenedentes bacterium]|nr:hypothetical protein [Candidatus Hydrogenedentota bacterium]
PPREYSIIPFWFLNDDLEKGELLRQLDDFAAHGVYGVVPHARMGLAREFAFMSDRWLEMIACCVEHAAERDMKIILYDEGMYPSGSCAGQVVAANPHHATRALERRKRGSALEGEEEVIYEDDTWMYVNTRSMGVIRGVHYGMDDSDADAPASADILNPESVASFLHLTHDRHYEVLGKHFGKTVLAIFTDEPSVLGRGHKKDIKPWTWEFEDFLDTFLGYDFRPHLAALWENTPESLPLKKEFSRAVNARLEQSYYKQYSEWCIAHHITLTGHPAGSMDIGTLKHFQLPGQDVVWRYLEPFQEKSLEGPHSTMGKCSSSAKVNYGRSRNLNECFGAYGWEFTWEEMRWLSDWLLVRGVDMLSPHAFYYSVRGERRNERPPDVGPNNVWWDRYKPYADYCRRISWLNAVGKQVCDIAILTTATQLPWRAARVLFEHQRDFNYLDGDTLLSTAKVTKKGILVGDMHYKALIIDGSDTVEPGVVDALQPLIASGAVFVYQDIPHGISGPALDSETLLEALSVFIPDDIVLAPPHPDIRYRHVVIDGGHFYFITNEGKQQVETG